MDDVLPPRKLQEERREIVTGRRPRNDEDQAQAPAPLRVETALIRFVELPSPGIGKELLAENSWQRYDGSAKHQEGRPRELAIVARRDPLFEKSRRGGHGGICGA